MWQVAPFLLTQTYFEYKSKSKIKNTKKLQLHESPSGKTKT